jgi:hypothetical protein
VLGRPVDERAGGRITSANRLSPAAGSCTVANHMRTGTGVVLAVLALTFWACGDDRTDTVTGTVEPEANTATAAEPEPQSAQDCATLLSDEKGSGTCAEDTGSVRVSAAGRGTAIGDLAIRIKSVRLATEIPAGYEGAQPSRTTGRFVILRVNVRNRGAKPLNWDNLLDGRSQLLVDTKTFDHDGNAESNLPGSLDSVGQSIPPDGSSDRSLVFDVTKPSVSNVRDGFLVFISTADLENGLDPSTAGKIGLVRVPG